jgi:histidinol-phosphate phosphatase family protein
MTAEPGKAVFLDKDGTLIDDVPYNVDPDRIRLAAGASEGLRALHAAGFALVVVSNQSGVALGRFPEDALAAVRDRLEALLGDFGVPVADFLFCPHHPDGVAPGYAIACECRKPAPGLILRAARDRGIDLDRSWLVGDILDDIEAGHRAGCRTVLLDVGNETEWRLRPERIPHFRAADLAEAARVILANQGRTEPRSATETSLG